MKFKARFIALDIIKNEDGFLFIFVNILFGRKYSYIEWKGLSWDTHFYSIKSNWIEYENHFKNGCNIHLLNVL